MKSDKLSGQTVPPYRESGGRHAHSPLLKTAAAVLLLLLAAALFCGAAAAATGGTSGGIYWEISETTLKITAAWNPESGYQSGEMKDYLSEEDVPWMSSRDRLKELIIAPQVTTIGDYAFNKCSGFTGSLTIPNSVTSIGKDAFYDCHGLTGPLTLPDSVTTIGDWAFSSCWGFTGPLTIPNRVTAIGDSAFMGCKGFTGPLTLPDSVTTIGIYAFKGCSNFDIIYIAGTPSLIEGKYDTQIPLAATLGGKITEVPEKPNLATPEKAGYAFDGWYRNEDFSGGAVTTYEESGKYYAKWKPLLIKYNNKTFSAASGQPDSIIGGEGSPFNAENAIYDGNTNTLTLTNNVSLTAGTLEIVAPKSDTPFTIDLADKNLTGNNSASVITVAKEAELRVNGTTGKITGGRASFGGGVYVASGGTFTLESGSITGNSAQWSGGGVYVLSGGTFTMNGGTISGNTASPPRSTESYCSGGGVYNLGTFTMNNGTISENVIRGGERNFGGGVYVAGTFIMNAGNISGNCILEGREAIGGGVYVASGGTFTLESGSITGNRVETSDLYCYGGGVYVTGTDSTFKVSGDPVISGNTAQGAVNNVHLVNAEKLTLTGPLTEGADIRISKVDGKQIAAGQPFGLVAEDVTVTTDDAKHFHNDAGTLHGKPGDNHTLIWGTTPTEATTSAPFESDGGIKTAKVTDPASILQKVTTDESSNVSWLVFKPHETLGDLPVTIDGREVAIVDDSFKMILGNAEELTEPQREISASGSSPAAADSALAVSPGRQPYPAPSDIVPAAGVQATLSGKLSAERIDGQENKLRLAQKTDADKWVLHPVSNGKKTEDGYYTFDAAFTSTKNGGYMFVIAEGTDPTPAPKSSSTQGTSIWLTAEPTTAPATPAPTPTPTPEVPQVKPVETKQAETPVPFMGILAGLGCAAVVFGLRRK